MEKNKLVVNVEEVKSYEVLGELFKSEEDAKEYKKEVEQKLMSSEGQGIKKALEKVHSYLVKVHKIGKVYKSGYVSGYVKLDVKGLKNDEYQQLLLQLKAYKVKYEIEGESLKVEPKVLGSREKEFSKSEMLKTALKDLVV